ncbi:MULTISPECIES: helix-turn-helix domain-containing protein [unclassified Duganella]|uniref:helix-turn-helix domain-containing protein n=1 Tax=unclassified Duganella TaxID=2636909 RepID=UPI0011C15CE4|nr:MULTISPECIES: helix-turn-helix domain-containing protein [unclassified Duganella]
MRSQLNLLNDPNYDPNRLLNAVLAKLNLKNDAALARMLGVAPPVLSKVRHRRLPVAASLILQIHDATRFSINEIRGLMGEARVF